MLAQLDSFFGLAIREYITCRKFVLMFVSHSICLEYLLASTVARASTHDCMFLKLKPKNCQSLNFHTPLSGTVCMGGTGRGTMCWYVLLWLWSVLFAKFK